MKKTRILYITSTLKTSGPVNQLLGRVSNLDRSKYEVKVLTLSPDPLRNRRKDFTDVNINLDSLNLSRAQFQLKGKQCLKKYIKSYNPEIIHTSGLRADVFVSKLGLKSKHCMTIENFVYDDHIAKFGKVVGRFTARTSIKAMKRCDYVICCSKTLKMKYSEILDHKLYVVQNGVDVSRFHPIVNNCEKNVLRDLLGLPKEKIVFTVLGGLSKRKDPLVIINAFNKLNYKSRATLLILGDGELLEDCRDIANENVILKGNVSNVSEYIRASDVYISASHSEGLPTSVLEAGACGLNIILSDIPQHKEIFEDDLNLVSWFSIGDEAELSKILSNIINNCTLTINKDVLQIIREKFSNQVMSNNYQQIYELMVKNS